MDIETRLTNLENLVNSFIKSQGLQKQYSDADINGVRKGVGDNSADIQQNTEDIDKNTADIEYLAIMSDIDI